MFTIYLLMRFSWVHREVGDGRHMAVERHQGKEQLVQILRRRQAEEGAALADKRSVVGQDVPGAVGGVPLKEVVDGAVSKKWRVRGGMSSTSKAFSASLARFISFCSWVRVCEVRVAKALSE